MGGFALVNHDFRIFVKSEYPNLGNDIKMKKDVEAFFARFGTILDCHFPRSQLAVCYISYQNEEACADALKTRTYTIQNIKFYVDRASKRSVVNPYECAGKIHIQGYIHIYIIFQIIFWFRFPFSKL